MKEFLTASLRKVREANPGRKMGNMDRRLFKMFIEAGEFAEAFQHVTSASNPKNKSWADVREEGIDTLIPIMDILLTVMPDQEDSPSQRFDRLVADACAPVAWNIFFDETEGLKFFVLAGRFTEAYLAARVDRNQTEAAWGNFRRAGILAMQKLTNMLAIEMDDQPGSDEQQRFETLSTYMDMKLDKWRHNRATGRQTTEDDV